MPITVHYSYALDGPSFETADQIKAFVSNLIPTPLPADLKITVRPPLGLTIEYSLDHADADAAATAAEKALRMEAPL